MTWGVVHGCYDHTIPSRNLESFHPVRENGPAHSRPAISMCFHRRNKAPGFWSFKYCRESQSMPFQIFFSGYSWYHMHRKGTSSSHPGGASTAHSVYHRIKDLFFLSHNPSLDAILFLSGSFQSPQPHVPLLSRLVGGSLPILSQARITNATGIKSPLLRQTLILYSFSIWLWYN